MQNKKKLKILFVSAEVSPFAKTGGLADVAGSLPQALAAEGNDVRVVMPKYRMIKCDMNYVTDFPIQMDNRAETCIIRESSMNYKSGGTQGKVPVYFVDSYHYYDREGIYCHHDDAERFIFLCRAAVEMLPRINFKPDIIHCNDWHTGPVCMLLREKFGDDPFYKGIATAFTIHNLEYQGHFSKDTIRFFNIDRDIFTPEKVEFYGMFNFMKSGLVYADKINTVSETYAREIQTADYGERLEGLLSKRSGDLCGIVNGISYEEFNPSEDNRIFRNYNTGTFREGKRQNKHALQREMELPERDVPVLGLVSRLAGQKGLNLILEAADSILKHDVQFVLLGMGDEYYENSFRSIMSKYPEKVSVHIAFNAPLAQRIYAGSDIFLMPSRFEPCGLGQLISLRYGTIPVVRATGGLADTVIDYSENPVQGNGFSFNELDAGEMLHAIESALELYRNEPEQWNALVQRAIAADNSWRKPALKYMDMYSKALDRKISGSSL